LVVITTALPAGGLASPGQLFGRSFDISGRWPASRGGRDDGRSSRTAVRPESARWPTPRTSRSVAAGSLAGTGGRCWRRAQAAC